MKTYKIVKLAVALVATVGLMFQGFSPARAAEQNSKSSIDVSKVRVPEVYGTVKEAHKGNDKVIFYLQDAHCNLEAQQNNSRILQDLINQYGLNTVCVEGSSGPIDISELVSFPDKEAMADVASYFMSQGRISGPEYLAITGDKPFALVGLEEKALYDQNKESFIQVAGFQKDASAQFGAVSKAMDQVAQKTFPADLKAFASKASEYRNGKIKFTEFASAMRDAATKAGVDISSFKNFDQQGKSFAMESKINFDAVEDERAAIVDELSKKLAKEDSSNLVVQSLSFRLGRMTASEYYDLLKSYCEKATVDLKSKANLAQYIDYIKVFEQIDKDALVDEASAVEAAIKDKMFTSDDQRSLDKMLRHVEMVSKMFEIKLGIRDYKVYTKTAAENTVPAIVAFVKDQASKNGVEVPNMNEASMTDHVAGIENFYGVAAKRDEVLANNAMAMMSDKKLDRMAMVTGGFHTGGIAEKLKAAGFSVVVITPRITDFDVKSPYMDVMLGKKTSAEMLFAGDSIAVQTLAPETALSKPKVRQVIAGLATVETRMNAMRAANVVTEPDRAALEDAINSLRPADKKIQLKIPKVGVYVLASATPTEWESTVGTTTTKYPAGVVLVLKEPGVVFDPTSVGLNATDIAGGHTVALGPVNLGVQVLPVDVGARNLYTAFLGVRGIPLPTPGGTAAKVAGKAADETRQTAAGLAIAAESVVPGVQTAIQDLLTSKLGTSPTLTNVEFVVVDPATAPAGVLTTDGMSFDYDTTIGHAQIYFVRNPSGVPIKAIIGIPKGLYDTIGTANTEEEFHLLLALVKDIEKARAHMDGIDLVVANMMGLRAEAAVSKALILGGLEHYIKDNKLEQLIGMATEDQTGMEIAKIMGTTAAPSPLAGRPDLQEFATALAKEMQAHIMAMLYAKAKADPAAFRVSTSAITNPERKLVVNQILALVGLPTETASNNPGAGFVFAGFDIAAGEMAYRKDGVEALTKVPMNADALEALRGVYPGFTYDDPSKAKIDQSLREVLRQKEMAAIVKPYSDLNASYRAARTGRSEHIWSAKRLLTYDARNGKPIKYVPTSPNVVSEMNEIIMNSQDDFYVTADDLTSAEILAATLQRGLGAEKFAEWVATGRFHLIIVDPNANVTAEARAKNIHAQIEASAGPNRPIKRLWAAVQGDGAVATFNGNTYYKVVEAPEGVPFDWVMSALAASTNAERDALKRQLAAYGVDEVTAGSLVKAAKDGGLIPLMKAAESVSTSMNSDPRSVDTAA